jgi:hypothetical protein
MQQSKLFYIFFTVIQNDEMTVCVRLVSSPKFDGFATRAYIPALKDGVLRAKLINSPSPAPAGHPLPQV